MKGKRKTRSRAMAFTPEMQDAVMGMPNDEMAGELALAIMGYAFHGTECESGDGMVRAEFERLRPQIDQSVTPDALKDAGHTLWGDIRAAVRSWILRIRIRLYRAFHRTEGE